MNGKRKRNTIITRSTLLRCAVSALILLVVIVQVDLTAVGKLLQRAKPTYLAVALVLVVLNRLIVAAKWKALLDSSLIHIPLRQVIRIVFISDLLGLVFPTGLGTDAARLFQIRGRAKCLATGAGTIVADRLLGVLLMTLVSLSALVLCWDQFVEHEQKQVKVAIIAACGLIWCAVTVLVWGPLFKWCRAIAELLMHASVITKSRFVAVISRVLAKLSEVQLALQELLKRPYTVAQVSCLSLTFLAIRITFIHLLFRSLGIEVPVHYVVAVVPLVRLLILLPISLFGIGVREGTFIYFFSAFGVDTAAAVGVSLLVYGLDLAVILSAGTLAMITNGKETRPVGVGARSRINSTQTPPSEDSASSNEALA